MITINLRLQVPITYQYPMNVSTYPCYKKDPTNISTHTVSATRMWVNILQWGLVFTVQ